jgi:hypothetical protein
MLKFSERLYWILLRLYPSGFRRDYSNLMAQVFRTQYRETVDQQGKLGLVGLWLHILADTFAAAFIEHSAAWKTSLTTQAPIVYSVRHAWILLPLIGIITYLYVLHDTQDMSIIYLFILATGVIAWVLNRLGLISLNPIWNMYVIGILLGMIRIIFYMLSSYPATTIYQAELPFFLFGIVAGLIYIAFIKLGIGLIRPFTRIYRAAAIFLALTSIGAVLLNPTYFGNTGEPIAFLSLHFNLMQALTALLIAVVGVQLARRYGSLAFIAVMIAFGVQFIVVDPGYFTGNAGRWINLCVLLFSVVVCPAWWLLVPNNRLQIRGLLILWGITVCVIAFAPSLARSNMMLDYETPAVWVFRALMALPYFVAMGLALKVWETDAARSNIQSENVIVAD